MKQIKKLIKEFEGLCLEAYRCPAGVWTIGWGHTPGVTPGRKITVEEAERLLDEDLKPILATLPPGLNENQRAALASLCYNIGTGAFMKSTIRRLVCANPEDPRIPDEFLRWRFAGGRELPGLVRRRKKEAAIYAGAPF